MSVNARERAMSWQWTWQIWERDKCSICSGENEWVVFEMVCAYKIISILSTREYTVNAMKYSFVAISPKNVNTCTPILLCIYNWISKNTQLFAFGIHGCILSRWHAYERVDMNIHPICMFLAIDITFLLRCHWCLLCVCVVVVFFYPK